VVKVMTQQPKLSEEIPACANEENSVSDTILARQKGRAMAQVRRVAAWVLVTAAIGFLVLVSTIGAVWPG
jgi:hypothetical protein